MLDTETKRKIDNARDILVGKIPDPKAQVEQITIALIFKFMDDMDLQSIRLGGNASFFTGEFEQYAWHRLTSPSLGGHERLNLYMQALMRMDENPNLPTLFRNIFKNAYLPYNAPDTLNLFVKEIDGFTYDHSERLGDAFEYLLMVLGSQGDAGQFRTPRHIIEFIVDCVNPTKEDRILDPACGTAGFLISAYKHILEQHGEDNPLTGAEREELMKNFTGYDISPDMVRLALVNLYLHNFPNPNIVEYDTLSSEDRWDEYAEVILANPPFMTPKGGIIPHKRFSIQANRSEVLFVDYIAEHLTTDGRAGIIVPEGIIFQSSNAYKNLRKMLVEENFLYAVVSLPAGVFNPYSGVKTSILLMDREIARQTDQILFVKIEQDGYDLGAQRNTIEANDLPQALQLIRRFQQDPNFDWEENDLAIAVKKVKIAEDGDFNLSENRYRAMQPLATNWNVVEIGEISNLIGGGTPSKSKPEYWSNGDIKWISSKYIDAGGAINGYDYITQQAVNESSTGVVPTGGTILITRVSVGKYGIADENYAINQDLTGIFPKDENTVSSKYIQTLAPKIAEIVDKNATGIGVRGVTRKFLASIQIPLPPLAVQEEIVAEIESYQRVIDGARQVLESYQPRIPIDPDWPMVELGEVCENLDSIRIPIAKGERKPGEYPYYGASGIVDWVDGYLFDEKLLLISEDGANLLARSTPIAFTAEGKYWVNNHAHVLRFKSGITHKFVERFINQTDISIYVTGAAQPKLNQKNLNGIKIPLPPIEIQREIVAQIEKEQAFVDANHRLTEIFEQKIEDKIDSIWNGKKEEE